jgi:hypothetical protein
MMSVNGVETASTPSSSSQGTVDRLTQSSTRGKPRKRYHGTDPFRWKSLTIDRMKPQTTNQSRQDNTPRAPRRPPGLSTPPEPVSESEGRAADEEDSDGELCFICGNSMKGRYYSLAPCNNAFCHNCSLRLRALYKSTNCPFCKVFLF